MDSVYSMERMAGVIVKERQAEADARRLARQIERLSQRPARVRSAYRPSITDHELEVWMEAIPGLRAG